MGLKSPFNQGCTTQISRGKKLESTNAKTDRFLPTLRVFLSNKQAERTIFFYFAGQIWPVGRMMHDVLIQIYRLWGIWLLT